MSILGPSGAYRRQLNTVKKEKKREEPTGRVCLCVRTPLRIRSRARRRVRVTDALIRIRMTDRFFSPRSLNRLTILAPRRHARRECRYPAITVPRPSPRASNTKRSNAEWGFKNVYRVERAWKIGTDKYEIVAAWRTRRTRSTFKSVELTVNDNNRDCFERLGQWLMLSRTNNNDETIHFS